MCKRDDIYGIWQKYINDQVTGIGGLLLNDWNY
jgi:hypothetical protein